MRAEVEHYVPQCGTGAGRGAVWGWTLAVGGTLALLGLIVAAPLAQTAGHVFAAQVLYGAFGRLCHQLSARSYWLAGAPLAVCARCTGLYAGLALGALGYPLLRRPLARTDTPARRWLFVAAVPLALDFTLGVTGLWANTHTSRALSGLLFGATAAFYVVPGLCGLGRRCADWWTPAGGGYHASVAQLERD